MCRAPLSVDVFGIFVSCVGRLSTFIPLLGWMPTQKGASHIHFYPQAKAHSPDVHLPICSHGLGLERGWSCTAKSPCIQKKRRVAFDRSQSSSYLRDCSAELMAKRLAPATFSCHKDIPYISPVSLPYRKARTPPSNPSLPQSHTKPRPRHQPQAQSLSVACLDQSRQSSPFGFSPRVD